MWSLDGLQATRGPKKHNKPASNYPRTPPVTFGLRGAGFQSRFKNERGKVDLPRISILIEPAEAELIVSGFNMEHGDKVPRVVQGKCDDWFRKSAAKEERSLVALSGPRESEIKKIDRMLKLG